MKKLQSHKKKNLKYPALVAGLIGSLALSSCKEDTPRLPGEAPIKTEKDQPKIEQPQPRVKEKIKVEPKPQRLMGEMPPPPDKEPPRLLGKMKISQSPRLFGEIKIPPKIEE